MPKVRCAALSAIETWFNSREHLPPRFHAEKTDQWEARVMFMRDPVEIEVLWGEGPSSKDRKRLCSLAQRYRLDLLVEWEHAVCISEPGPNE
jgi:hypothetical protein